MSDLHTHVQTMATYNAWMNARLYEACANLSDDLRKKNLGAFFKSIHGTLNHLLLADRVWMGRFTGVPFSVRSLDQELYADFDKLWRERTETDHAISQWTKTLTPDAFARDLSFMSVQNPQPRRVPLWLAATHFFNHQTHHRGQLTTLMMQNGVDPGVTDLLVVPR